MKTMDPDPIQGIAVWRFELAHIQVPLRTIQKGEEVHAVITDMAYPANKLCVSIRSNNGVIGFPPDFLETDIIAAIEEIAARQNMDGYVLRGRVASIEQGRPIVELGLIRA
jgi:hypothetical protein